MQQRIHEYDIIKCIGIVMVVMGHTKSGDYISHSVNFVHMALFFLLAGCTNRKDDYYTSVYNLKFFFWKRIKSLYIPFLKYSLPIILLHNFFYYQGWYTNCYSLQGWIEQISRTILFSIGTTEPLLAQLWFIKVLFITELLYAFLLYVLQRCHVNKWIIIIPLGVLALLVNHEWFPHFFRMNLIVPFRALLIYSIGGEMWRLVQIRNNITIIIAGGGVILWLFASTLFDETSILGAYGIAGLLIIPFSVCLFVVLWNFCKYIMKINLIDAIIEYVGRNTLPVYFLHYLAFRVITISYLFILGTDTAYSRNHVEDIPWWLYVVLSIAISLAFYEMTCCFKKIIEKRK